MRNNDEFIKIHINQYTTCIDNVVANHMKCETMEQKNNKHEKKEKQRQKKASKQMKFFITNVHRHYIPAVIFLKMVRYDAIVTSYMPVSDACARVKL